MPHTNKHVHRGSDHRTSRTALSLVLSASLAFGGIPAQAIAEEVDGIVEIGA